MPPIYDENRDLLTCWEYEKLTYSNTKLPISNFDNLVDDLDEINHELTDRGITESFPFDITGYNREIKFTKEVGIVQAGDLTLQVLPKVSRDYDTNKALTNLLLMLAYSQKLEVDTDTLTELSEQPDTIVEALIFFFARGLEKALSHGIHRTYILQEYSSRFLKGKMMMEKEIVKTDKSHFWIRTSDYIEDNELNRFLKAATKAFIGLIRSWEIRRVLARILGYLVDVSDLRLDSIEHQRIYFTRLNAVYEPPYLLARVVLGRSSVSLSEKKFRSYHFLVDMNQLFEAFITYFLEENKTALGIPNHTISIQSVGMGPYYLGRWEPGARDSQLKPDVALMSPQDSSPVLILDTKYKEVDDLQLPNPDTGDLYQLFAYLQKLKCSTGLILYPSYSETKLFEKSFRFDDDHVLHLAKVRLNFEGENWRETLASEIRDWILLPLLAGRAKTILPSTRAGPAAKQTSSLGPKI